MFEKWKRAVIHLEGLTDSQSLQEQLKRDDEFSKRYQAGEISVEELVQSRWKGSRDLRYQGTAIFLRHDGRRYLLTARHVLFDEVQAGHLLQEENERMKYFPEVVRQMNMQRAMNYIFRTIFKIPTLDEVIKDDFDYSKATLHIGAGSDSMNDYTFSQPELDLAIISLDAPNSMNSDFTDELERQGYKPVESSDIQDQPSSEGANVFTVGFPGATSVVGELALSRALANWRSPYVSLPAFAFGHVSMLHNALPYFWCDMSLYPGNSGGPIIEAGKLVGIVSAQAIIPVGSTDQSDPARSLGVVGIPFGKIIKATYIKQMLDIQVQKDAELSNFLSRVNN